MIFMNGQQIYDNFQEGAGPEGLTGGAAIVNEVAGDYETRAQQIHALVTRMESAWRGDASGAAKRGAGPVASEHELSGQSLATTQDMTTRQAEAYTDAKNAVMPVPPKPMLVDPMTAMISPGGLTPFEDQVDEHNAAARHNVDMMNRYTSASAGNWDGLPPSYGTFVDGTSEDPAGASVSTGGPGMSSGVIDSDDYKTSDDSAGAAESGDDEHGSGSPGPGPGGDTGDQAASPTGAGPGTLDPSESGATTPGGFTPTTPSAPVIGGGDSGVGTGRPLGGGPMPGVGVVAGPGFGGGPGGSPGGPGGGGPGGGPRGGAVAGPRGGVLGAPGVGGEPHGSRPGPAGAVAGVSGRGAAGMSGVPMGGAGRGRDGEDTERKRPPYLEGGDPDELFDTDQLTAPPTIGEDDDN